MERVVATRFIYDPFTGLEGRSDGVEHGGWYASMRSRSRFVRIQCRVRCLPPIHGTLFCQVLFAYLRPTSLLRATSSRTSRLLSASISYSVFKGILSVHINRKISYLRTYILFLDGNIKNNSKTSAKCVKCNMYCVMFLI